MKSKSKEHEKNKVTPPNANAVARRAADLVNQLDDREAFRTLWNALDEPVRENLLVWFAEWDKKFCEILNPKPA